MANKTTTMPMKGKKKYEERLFSKALFKQSCKANGTMWMIIAAAVCFMLACVMLISGSGSLGEVKNSIQDTIIRKEVDSQLEQRGLNYYLMSKDGMETFDPAFEANINDTVSYLTWLSQKPADASQIPAWMALKPEMKTAAGKAFEQKVSEDPATYANSAAAFKAAYEGAAAAVQAKATVAADAAAVDKNGVPYAKDSAEYKTVAQEVTAAYLFSVATYSSETFTAMLANEKEADKPADYSAALIANLTHLSAYLQSDERAEYIEERAQYCSSVFLAFNMTQPANVQNIVNALSSFGVTQEKYDSFGYNYAAIKNLAATTVVSYRGRFSFEKGELDKKLTAGEITADEYKAALAAKTDEITGDLTDSLLASLPESVSEALEEIGQADLYTLIVGSIFYKLAGLLLPIIFMIMASNNLIAGQVDSGSMAYVLSTSTKRKTVVFTQAMYLIGSLLSMFVLTAITSFICLAFVKSDVTLTCGKLALLNFGAFLVLFALSGLCFFTSCWFDRSKRSMAIGGGLSIFSLVAAMLGLFGSPVIPSVVRMDSLNYFNKVTVISFFDVISIMDGTNAFLWKFAILFALGILGYIVGSIRFTKKDLPL